MKKIFEKHTVAKLLGILLFVAVILSWFIPYSAFEGSELIKTEKAFIGLNDLSSVLSTSINFIIDKIIYLLVLGGFYAIISKTEGYRKMVSGISKAIKGKEVIFVIITSVVLTVLTSVLTYSFIALLFVPMLIAILRNAGINKVTTFAATFGAILVGILGATYGYDGLLTFNAYFSQTFTSKSAMKMTLGYRFIILLIAVALYNFFLYFGVKKSLDTKKKKSDLKEDNEFIIEPVKSKNAKTFPIAIVLFLVLVFAILGFVDWKGIFNLTIFDEFHEWLIGLKIGKDFTFISYLLGRTSSAFGTWGLLNMSVVLVVLSLLTKVMYDIKFDEYFTLFGEGIKKMVKPVGVIIAVYAVFVTTYMGGIIPKITDDIMHINPVPKYNIDYNGAGVAIFNVDDDKDGKVDYNPMNQDVDNDGVCDLNCDTNKDGYPDKNIDINGDQKVDDTDEMIINQLTGTSTLNQDVDGDGIADININKEFNLFKAVVGSMVVNVFNTDLGYTSYSMGGYLLANYGSHVKLIFIMFVLIHGLFQFFIPTGMLLALGLVYTDLDLKDWIKYIWRFVLGMLCVILLMFIFILIM